MQINPQTIPTGPGLYFFKGLKNKILYIGKAANLRARIRSYFSATQTQKVSRLLRESRQLNLLPLESEIEALIKEAALIKRYRPKYNVLLRDDKNYFYVVVTDEKFPRIFTTHQPERFRNSPLLGPFVSGRALKTTLRLLRKHFPYCTCVKPHHRSCLQSQLSLCPGYCCKIGAEPSPNDALRYHRAISRIKSILAGRRSALDAALRRKLTTLARSKKFEEAAETRDQLRGLERVFAHRGLLVALEPQPAKTAEPRTLRDLALILGLPAPPRRIEFYDASVLSGTGAVGGMSAWQNNTADKSSWRLFRMRRSGTPNDPAQISEMLERRLAHREWKFPDLVIVDGGIAQYRVGELAVRRAGLKIPVAAVAKGKPQRDRLLWGGASIKIIPLSKLPPNVANLLRRMRDATHRFALGFQRRKQRQLNKM